MEHKSKKLLTNIVTNIPPGFPRTFTCSSESGFSFRSNPAPKPFTKEGEYDDEITLDFGEKNLYVPKNFPTVASPVFDAMFKHKFREKEEKRVQMIGKSYEDFLEFLLCIHPRILKEIDDKNVLRIAPFAEEYQVTAVVTKCMTVMKSRCQWH